MATENIRDGIIEITSIAADWDYDTIRPAGWPSKPRLLSINFVPGAADDTILIRVNDTTGPQCFYARCENVYDQRIEYYHGSRFRPFIDFSECTLSAGHKLIIKLWRDS
jgi:hypothetical protein